MITTDNEKKDILIIDDEPWVRSLLLAVLGEDYLCEAASSAEESLALLQTRKFDLVLSDIKMDGMSGLQLIPRVLDFAPDTVVMMISGEQTIENAIEALRVGAFDYIQKPFSIEYLETAVERAINHQELLKAKHQYENQLKESVETRTAQLNYVTYHDKLTSLPNLILFEDRLDQALVSAQYNKQNLAVIILTLDRFQKINDILGHDRGDELLLTVAGRLKKAMVRGEGATLARFESDKFAILLPQIGDTKDIIETADKINEALNRPLMIDDYELFTTMSMGISFFPDDGHDTQTLLKNACTALHRVREQGGNAYQFYTTDMNSKALAELVLENNLRQAIERCEFEVYYQPKIDIKTGKILGMEALVRWQHPESGLLYPGQFIPLAEETGLIIPLGEWILRTACQQCKLWQDEGFEPLRVSVNASASQFQNQDFPEVVTGIIRDSGLHPNQLELEITESLLMKNAGLAIKTLSRLREIGVVISIDDFGTGYSSLGYLKRLPIDILKIDKSFVQDVNDNAGDESLVNAIITLAHNLNLKVVAEGVETAEQLRVLQTLGCDEWQGFFFSKPLSAGYFRQLLGESGKSRVLP